MSKTLDRYAEPGRYHPSAGNKKYILRYAVGDVVRVQAFVGEIEPRYLFASPTPSNPHVATLIWTLARVVDVDEDKHPTILFLLESETYIARSDCFFVEPV